MRIRILGRVLLLDGGSRNFSVITEEINQIGEGSEGNPQLPVGQFLPNEVKIQIHNGAVVVTVFFAAIDVRKDYGLPLQQHDSDRFTVVIDEFNGNVTGVAELHCFVTPSNEELPYLHQRLTKMGYGGEAEVVEN